MKYLKFVLFAYALTACFVAKAQSEQAEKSFDPRCHFLLEAKVGRYHYNRGGFGMNFVVERELCKYLAWDIASVDFSAPWNCDLVNIGIKTGVKGFTPRFWENRMRVYASVAVGYDCGIITISKSKMSPIAERTGHGFAFSSGAGLQLGEHLFVGYDLEYSTSVIDKGRFGIAHYAKLGWRF